MADRTLQSLRERIDETITNASESIQDRVHNHYVETELERRSQIIVSGVNAHREAEADRNKINRPDQILYDGDGKPHQSLYSKSRIDEIKKVNERVERLQAVIDKAIETNAADDYKKLEDIVKRGKSGGGARGGQSSDETAE